MINNIPVVAYTKSVVYSQTGDPSVLGSSIAI